MFSFTSSELQVMVASLIWPLTRILGLIAAAPLFGNRGVPGRLKVWLGILLTITISPLLPNGPAQDPTSFAGLLILAQQFIIGIAIGFSMRIVFATVELAGELIGLTMGLGFATLFDPQSQGRSSAISQFLALIATMAYLAINGHLLLIASLAESFTTLPISPAPLTGSGFYQIAQWGGKIFSTGVQLSLPIITALLITNVALAILTRAAPQLNIFGIGFPLTLGLGFLLVWLMLPYMAVPIENLLLAGFDKLGQITRALAGLPVGPVGLK